MTSAVLTGLVRSAFADVLRAEGVAATAPTAELRRCTGGGDYATSIALRSAKATGVPPRRLALRLADRLTESPRVAHADVAGAGFVNLRLSAAAHVEVLRAVLAAGVAALPEPELPADTDDPTTARSRCHADVARRCGLPVRTVGEVTGAADWAGLVRELGADVARYALLRGDPGAPLRLDLRPLAREHDDNPAYLVRFTHAHLLALLRHADDLGVPGGADPSTVDSLALESTELLLDIAAAHDARGGSALTGCAERLAGSWWACGLGERVLPRGDEIPGAAHARGIVVAAAVATALANCLALLGVSAPERM